MVSRQVWLGSLVAVATLVAAQGHAAEARSFDGPFVGIDLGRHNVIAGSQADGVDLLQQEVRSAVTLSAGFRQQLGGGLVIGAEAGYGWLDGGLRLAEPAGGLVIDYAGDSQTYFGLTLGQTLGASRRVLVFAYVNELSRSFDVRIQAGSSSFRQNDEQGLLRYGTGAELSLAGPLRARVTAGSSRAKFDGPTNIDPEAKLEASVGFVIQF